MAFGMVMLYSSGIAHGGARYLMLQLAWCGMGLVLCVAAVVIDYRLIKKAAWPIFILAIVVLTLIAQPGPRNGQNLSTTAEKLVGVGISPLVGGGPAGCSSKRNGRFPPQLSQSRPR